MLVQQGLPPNSQPNAQWPASSPPDCRQTPCYRPPTDVVGRHCSHLSNGQKFVSACSATRQSFCLMVTACRHLIIFQFRSAGSGFHCPARKAGQPISWSVHLLTCDAPKGNPAKKTVTPKLYPTVGLYPPKPVSIHTDTCLRTR